MIDLLRHVEGGESEDDCCANINSYRRNPYLGGHDEQYALECWHHLDPYQSLANHRPDHHYIDLELMSLFADYYRLHQSMAYGFQSILQQQHHQLPGNLPYFDEDADIAEEHAHIDRVHAAFDDLSLPSLFSSAVTLEIGERLPTISPDLSLVSSSFSLPHDSLCS